MQRDAGGGGGEDDQINKSHIILYNNSYIVRRISGGCPRWHKSFVIPEMSPLLGRPVIEMVAQVAIKESKRESY